MTSSLPRYPQATPPPAAPTAASGRGWILFFQFLIIAAFWAGIYVLREQVLAFSETAKRAKGKKAIMGRWRSTQAPGVELELRYGRYRLLRNKTVSCDGEYDWSGNVLKLYWTRTAMRNGLYGSLHCRLAEDELLLWDDGTQWGKDGDWFLLRHVLGRETGARVYKEQKVLRFKRMSE